MEKRVIIAFILSFVVLYGFRALYSPPPSTAPASVQTTVPPPAPPPSAPASSASTPRSPSAKPVVVEEVLAEKPEDVVVDNALYTATISNVGGVLRSYKLKAYTDAMARPIELINEVGGGKVGWPLAFVTGDSALDEMLSKAPFAVRREDARLTLEYGANGVHAQKVFEFDRENYEISLQSTVSKDGMNIAHAIAWQGGFGDQSIAPDPAKKNAVYQVDAGFKRTALGSIKDEQEFTVARAGMDDQYFLAMFLVPDSPARVKVRKVEYPGADGKPVGTIRVAVGMPADKGVRIYVGPKQREWLTKADPQLTAVIDYGWFAFVAKPLVFCLLLIHSYIGNFGWAIILLTLSINLVLFPLRLKQQISMQKMQKIQPHMRTLQDRYKKLKPNDPKRAQLQSEMMGVYKEHGVNPMGGCLPLVLQMPVLFGFYSALFYSIELRRAPWILWIKDLSQYDPYYVIPILMAVSMIVMQKLTPTTVDPAQAKMMMIMPLMFTVMFVFQSSGLVLYWLTSNLIGIGQQVFINKYWSPHADAKLLARSRIREAPNK